MTDEDLRKLLDQIAGKTSKTTKVKVGIGWFFQIYTTIYYFSMIDGERQLIRMKRRKKKRKMILHQMMTKIMHRVL
jgi:hypothetical protein